MTHTGWWHLYIYIYHPGGRYAKIKRTSSLLRPAISKHRNTGSQTLYDSTQFASLGLLQHTSPGLSTWLRYSCPAQGQRSPRSWSRFLWNFQGWHIFSYLRGSCAAHAMCVTWMWFARDNVRDMNISEDPHTLQVSQNCGAGIAAHSKSKQETEKSKKKIFTKSRVTFHFGNSCQF